jgi:allophanate hydrolase
MSHPESIAQRLARFNDEAASAPANIWIDRSTVVAGADSGPLAGLLAAVKDNIDVAGFPTTAACPPFAYRPTRSATVVERLLAAGATVVGKTNLDQFACGLVGTRSPFGAVQNAFKPEYVSGGSSSGSAVAVALGLVDVSFGTDTAGSGRVPAGLNNIVGLKPSRGWMSTRGVVPASQHIDCVSIFAHTVPQAIDVLKAVAGHDPECPYSRPLALDPAAMPTQFRFGLPNAAQLEFFGDDLARTAFDEAVAALEGLSGTLSRVDYAPMLEAATALYEDVWVADRYASIREFFDTHPDDVDPTVRTIIGAGKKYVAADVFTAMGRMGLLRQYADGLWKDIDVLVVPTAPTAHTIAAVQADPIARNRELGYYTNFVNLLDLAAIAVPASMRADGLPFGITLIGPAGSELRLADLAQRFHQQTGLTLGATGRPLPHAVPIARPAGTTVKVAVVGAHLSGLPLNGQLLERGARLLSTSKTAPTYRFYALAGTVPPKPGMVRVAEGGVAIEAEVWEVPMREYGSFVAGIPGPLGIGTIELEDGSSVQGFLCEAAALAGAEDISSFGGWRAYMRRPSAAA